MGITNRQKSMVLSWAKSIFSERRATSQASNHAPAVSIPSQDLATASLACALLPANRQASSTNLHFFLVRGACPRPAHYADRVRRSSLWPARILCSHARTSFRDSSNLNLQYIFSRTHLKPKLIHSPSVLVPTLFPPQPLFPIHAELASFEIQILTGPAFAFCSFSAQRPSPHRASVVPMYVPDNLI
jgi:hypothetical protein